MFPYTLFAAIDQTDLLMAGAVLHHKGVVLDSIIEDRLLAETGKEEANRDLLKELTAKKRMASQLLLRTTSASSNNNSQRIQALQQEVENIEGKLARQGTDLGQVGVRSLFRPRRCGQRFPKMQRLSNTSGITISWEKKTSNGAMVRSC